MNYIDSITFFEIFSCDKCGEKARQISGEYKQDTIARLRGYGWKIGKRHICPNCSNPPNKRLARDR